MLGEVVVNREKVRIPGPAPLVRVWWLLRNHYTCTQHKIIVAQHTSTCGTHKATEHYHKGTLRKRGEKVQGHGCAWHTDTHAAKVPVQ